MFLSESDTKKRMILGVKTRLEVEGNGIALEEPYALISISCPNDPAKIRHRESCKAILRVEFDDLDAPVRDNLTDRVLPYTLFNDTHANQILDFFEDCVKWLPYMIVHCDAGVSRSPAVAAALTRIQESLDLDFWRRYIPNARVYSKIMQAWFARSER